MAGSSSKKEGGLQGFEKSPGQKCKNRAGKSDTDHALTKKRSKMGREGPPTKTTQIPDQSLERLHSLHLCPFPDQERSGRLKKGPRKEKICNAVSDISSSFFILACCVSAFAARSVIMVCRRPINMDSFSTFVDSAATSAFLPSATCAYTSWS